MNIALAKGALVDHKTPLMVIPLLSDESPLPYQPVGVKGEFKSVAISYHPYKGCEKLLFIGLGKKDDLTVERIRVAFGVAVRKVKDMDLTQFSVHIRKLPKLDSDDVAGAIAEGILLGSYEFDKYKTKKKEKTIQTCFFVGAEETAKRVRDTSLIALAVNTTRDMVNENADVMTTERMAAWAKEMAKKHKLKCTVLEKEQLEKLGMHLMLAVSKGSRYPPRLIIMEYKGSTKKESIALLGKGITFDSGGLNLKQTNAIETMKLDMAGSAVVLNTVLTAAQLGLKVNVIAVAAMCENMIGPQAYKPGDVYTSFAGKTVQIDSTDAEGRLVLADTIAYVEKTYKPTVMIDIATLTGASSIIFGEYVTAMIGTGDKFKSALFTAGERTYERVWELPLYDEYKEEVKGDIADLTNLGYRSTKNAGTIIGGAFLSHFSEKTPLIHLDIGNTAWRDRSNGYIPRFATGLGVRLLTEFLRSQV